MRRQILLLTGLTVAVVIALLLRTAASNVEPVAAAQPTEPDASVVAEFALEDCAIATEGAPRLSSTDAAQPLPLSPLDYIDPAVAFVADARAVSLARTLELEIPQQRHRLSRDTIRPPPPSHAL